MLVYASEVPETPSESDIDSEYDTLVQQNTEIIQQNETIIASLNDIDTCCGMIFMAIIISMVWRLGTYLVHSVFGSS